MAKRSVTWTLLRRILFSSLGRPPDYGLGPCASAQPCLEKKSSRVFGLFDRFLFRTFLDVPARVSRDTPAVCFTDTTGLEGAAEMIESRRANSRNTVLGNAPRRNGSDTLLFSSWCGPSLGPRQPSNHRFDRWVCEGSVVREKGLRAEDRRCGKSTTYFRLGPALRSLARSCRCCCFRPHRAFP